MLPGGPGRRNPEQRMCERFVVREQGKFSTFMEEPEVPHGGVSSQELSVKGGVTGFGGGKLLEEEGKQSPGTSNKLLEKSSDVKI